MNPIVWAVGILVGFASLLIIRASFLIPEPIITGFLILLTLVADAAFLIHFLKGVRYGRNDKQA
jgi:hypothetical protein